MPLSSSQAPYAVRASSVKTPVTGNTVTVPQGYGTQNIVISPAGALANLTILLPVSGLDGAEINLIFNQAITSLTWSGGAILGTAPATVAANTKVVLLWSAPNSSWYSEYGTSSGAAVGSSKSITTVTGSSALGSTNSTDYYVFVNSSSATVQTLPTAIGNTNIYSIKNINTGTVTLATVLGQTIDGVTSTTISTQNQSLALISDGSNWRIM